MNEETEYVFVGGLNDGKKKSIPDGHHIVTLQAPSTSDPWDKVEAFTMKTERYELIKFREVMFFKLVEMSLDEAIGKLLDRYSFCNAAKQTCGVESCDVAIGGTKEEMDANISRGIRGLSQGITKQLKTAGSDVDIRIAWVNINSANRNPEGLCGYFKSRILMNKPQD